jgi:hypothetical protein
MTIENTLPKPMLASLTQSGICLCLWQYDKHTINNLSWCRSIENLRTNIAGSIYWHTRTGRWK